MIKKIFYSLLTISSLFFITDNVFAMDMPSYLQDYYNYNTSNYTFNCGTQVESYCAMYTNLQQFFAEFFTLYQYNVTIKINKTNNTYIYFFLQEPTMYYMKNYNREGFAYYFQKDLSKVPYYLIQIYSSDKKINIYKSEGDDGSSGSILKPDYNYSFKTNFNLYDENSTLINKSNTLNYDYYYSLLPDRTMALMPKKCTQGSTGSFSYDKGNLFISQFSNTNNSFSDPIALDTPVSSNLSYTVSTFSSSSCSDLIFYIYNRGSETATIGFSSEDFEIVTFGNNYDNGHTSSGSSIPNHSSDFIDKVNKKEESIFDIILSLPNKIINGISNILKSLFVPSNDFLNNWFTSIRDGFEKQLGFLAYPITWILEVLNRFLTLNDTGSYVISWSAIKVPNFDTNIIEAGSFDLATLLNNPTIKSFHDIYFIIIDSLFLLSFFNLCINAYNRCFGGDVDNYEYISVDEGYTFDDKTGEVKSRWTKTRTTSRRKKA